ncbi:mycothiol synthase, partial [Sediminivirga luteola]
MDELTIAAAGYADEDLPRLRRALSLLEEIARLDGIPPVSDGLLEAARSGRAEVWLAEAPLRPGDAPTPVAAGVAALLGSRWSTEFAVLPGARGRGYGRALFERILADQEQLGVHSWFWSHGDFPAATALADSAGMARARELLQMQTGPRPVFPPPEPVPGIGLRTFRPGQDEEEWLRVNNAAFHWHPEQGGQRLEDFRAEARQPGFDPEGFFLAYEKERPSRILGFHRTKLSQREGKLVGEVYVVGVDPAVHGMGLGRLLTQAGLAHLSERGADLVELYVESDNLAALRLYESLGFSVAVR